MDHSVPATRMFIHKWNKPFVRRSHFAGAVFSHHPFPADPICSERVTMHCQWGRKPPKLPFPLRISSLAGRGPSNDHRQHTQKIGKDRACGSGYMLADTHTHTHIHTERERERERRAHHNTTILRHRFRGRSNEQYRCNSINTAQIAVVKDTDCILILLTHAWKLSMTAASYYAITADTVALRLHKK